MDTEGLLLKVKVHSAKVPDQDGLRLLCFSRRGVGSLWLETPLARRRLRRKGQTMGRASPRFERGGGRRAQAPQAHTREGSADLGAGGMGQGGQEEGPLAKAYAAARVGGFAEEEVGGGADLLLAWPQQEDEQGLRALVRERRSVQRSSTWP